MIKAIIFDFYGVLSEGILPNQRLLDLVREQLKPKYKLGVLSNALDEFMYQIIPKPELEKLFDNILVSYHTPFAKPDAEIFELALKNLHAKPTETIFIDDTKAFCEAASKLGLQTIHYQNFEQFRRDLEELLAAGADN